MMVLRRSSLRDFSSVIRNRGNYRSINPAATMDDGSIGIIDDESCATSFSLLVWMDRYR